MNSNKGIESVKDLKFEQALAKLNKVVEILREMGFRLTIKENYTTSDMLNYELADAGIPLVSEGAQGIRMFYLRRSGQLIIGFTNGFEESDEPKRVEFEKKLKEKGLGELLV